jgi:cytochrome c oxidase assembly protein subunit 11
MYSNSKIVKILLSIILFMMLLTIASVPIYDAFCKITGFGGSTKYNPNSSSYSDIQKNKNKKDNSGLIAGDSKLDSRLVTVEFDSNVEKSLKWKFYPLQKSITVKPGKSALAYFYAENISDKPIIGTSIFNVTPQKVGQYFVKIQCFCFEEQLLRPGESMKMPVLFTIDPDILTNEETSEVELITLSYTFFKVRELEK